ncbi:hypothetical protein FRC01_003785, partial [Tulasnella sp. 417]
MAQGGLPGSIELLDGLVPENNKPFRECLEALRSALLDCWNLNPDERPLISSILPDLSSLPPARSLLLQQQAAGRVERSNRMLSQQAMGIEVKSLLSNWKAPDSSELEAVIYPPTQDKPPHLSDISFSPDGKWLATCLDGQLPKLWSLEKDFDWRSPFPEANDNFLWSPDSQYLALVGKQGLHIWATNWETSKYYPSNTIDAITWFSNGDLAIMSEQRIYVLRLEEKGWKMDHQGSYVDSLPKVNDMASIPSHRALRPRIALIAAGAATAYDADNHKVVGDLVLIDTPRRITVTRDGEFVILGVWASEWDSSLELWRIEIPNNLEEPWSFNFVHRYASSESIIKSGLHNGAIFGEGNLVMATSSNGSIYMWETMSKYPGLEIRNHTYNNTGKHTAIASFYK